MKNLWIMVGPPASGKTWFALNVLYKVGWGYVSRDDIRFSILKDGEDYFSHENEVYEKFVRTIIFMLKQDDVYNVIADATHLNWRSRKKLIDNIKYYIGFSFKDINIIPVVINTDFETVKERNKKRFGRAAVPEENLKEIYYKYTDPQMDPYKYTGIMYV